MGKSNTVTVTVTAPAPVQTQLVLTATPPSGTAPLTFILTTALATAGPGGTRIPDKTVDLYENDVKISSGVTSSIGAISWQLTRGQGSYSYYTYFAGDATYAGCEAKRRAVRPGG
jgi:hypothetical protein